MAVKIKPNDEQDFKSFEVEIPNIGWEKRCELNNLMVSANKDEETSLINFCGEIVLKFTKLSEEELNDSQNVPGLSVKVIPQIFTSPAQKSTQLTIVGNQTGATTTVTVTVSKTNLGSPGAGSPSM